MAILCHNVAICSYSFIMWSYLPPNSCSCCHAAIFLTIVWLYYPLSVPASHHKRGHFIALSLQPPLSLLLYLRVMPIIFLLGSRGAQGLRGLRGPGQNIEKKKENLRGPGQNICSDHLNEVFDCSIRVHRSLGPISRVGPGQNTPVAPPLSAALARVAYDPFFTSLVTADVVATRD